MAHPTEWLSPPPRFAHRASQDEVWMFAISRSRSLPAQNYVVPPVAHLPQLFVRPASQDGQAARIDIFGSGSGKSCPGPIFSKSWLGEQIFAAGPENRDFARGGSGNRISGPGDRKIAIWPGLATGLAGSGNRSGNHFFRPRPFLLNRSELRKKVILLAPFWHFRVACQEFFVIYKHLKV